MHTAINAKYAWTSQAKAKAIKSEKLLFSPKSTQATEISSGKFKRKSFYKIHRNCVNRSSSETCSIRPSQRFFILNATLCSDLFYWVTCFMEKKASTTSQVWTNSSHSQAGSTICAQPEKQCCFCGVYTYPKILKKTTEKNRGEASPSTERCLTSSDLFFTAFGFISWLLVNDNSAQLTHTVNHQNLHCRHFCWYSDWLCFCFSPFLLSYTREVRWTKMPP